MFRESGAAFDAEEMLGEEFLAGTIGMEVSQCPGRACWDYLITY